MPPPRTVWLMIPAAAVDATIDALAPLLDRGDTIVDGGNSHYVDDIAPRAKHWRRAEFTTSTSAPAVASGVSSEATA